MELDTNNITKLCIKHKITIRDFFLLYCLVKEDLDNLRMYIDHSVDPWYSKEDWNRLYRKGLIDFKGVEGKNYDLENIPAEIIIVSPVFRRDILKKQLFS
ncbi:hypothetical protein [Pontibacter flavimaris]|uniref:Uncharacterized protein n=1 Tax=Pontibacter flavimaris TaxID=1797110 RepID=A0A1Q5PCI7_9BACT|nr:hypothetical protein [Pontibacter flavimaris]OKL39970.1 hypothetical protein A3841_16540 [Pontibacter flavimaris]